MKIQEVQPIQPPIPADVRLHFFVRVQAERDKRKQIPMYHGFFPHITICNYWFYSPFHRDTIPVHARYPTSATPRHDTPDTANGTTSPAVTAP